MSTAKTHCMFCSEQLIIPAHEVLLGRPHQGDTPMNAVLAACTTCPALVAAADETDLIPLMDEHTNKSGHRLWALSLLTHSRRTDEPARDAVGPGARTSGQPGTVGGATGTG